mmetsp:Transcript_31721/g.72875  ORF Transcript_31721/g.72875 Transcript_31721/m.72875 type:complete len:99 (-) Transcript_31721:103-399(-)
MAKCRVTMEFCCARKDSGDSMAAASSKMRDYVWSGLVRRTVDGSDLEKKHRARIVFLEAGSFVVSACAKIGQQEKKEEESSSTEETWWAPLAENVQVQ